MKYKAGSACVFVIRQKDLLGLKYLRRNAELLKFYFNRRLRKVKYELEIGRKYKSSIFFQKYIKYNVWVGLNESECMSLIVAFRRQKQIGL